MLDTIKTSYTIEMPPKEWAFVADNPRQRDTALHATKAKHLLRFAPPHADVHMAVLPDGRRFKLDGHTRSFLWENGEVVPPPILRVHVYRLSTEEEVSLAYEWFDSPMAVEKGPDVVQGAFRACDLAFNTSMLRTGRIGTALRQAYVSLVGGAGFEYFSFVSVRSAVLFFQKELEILDQLAPTPKLFSQGLQVAYFITMAGEAETAVVFWKKFIKEHGEKFGDEMDAVQALIEAALAKKHIRNTNREMMGKGLSAYLSYRAGERYLVQGRTGVKPLSERTVRKYIARKRKMLGFAE